MRAERNLELNLGKVCNNRCIFCLDGNAPAESRRWLPVERAREEMERARREGAVSVGLLGGEPTAHPRILDIVGEARRLGFERIALATNGLRIADTGRARDLVEAGVTRVGISVHSHLRDVEDRLSGREGNFDKKLAAVSNLVTLRSEGALGHNVSLNSVLNRLNADSMAEYAAFWRGRGIDDVRFNLIRTDACLERGAELTPRLRSLGPRILRAVAINEARLHMHITWGDLPLCAFPWEILSNPELASRSVGEVRDLDTWVAVFSAPKDGRREAQRFRWTDRKRDALKVQPREPCSRCRLAGRCEGVWRSYVAIHGPADLQPL